MAPRARFGLTLSNRGVLLGLTQPDEILEMAELAEASGAFDHVWVGDSIMAIRSRRRELSQIGVARAGKSAWALCFKWKVNSG